jgi:hypothetical protein
MLSLVRFCPAFLPYGLVPPSLEEANSASSLLELKFRMVSAVFIVIPTCVPHWILALCYACKVQPSLLFESRERLCENFDEG